jgi:hypothetical protein
MDFQFSFWVLGRNAVEQSARDFEKLEVMLVVIIVVKLEQIRNKYKRHI